jgi:transcriptional regulator with XRE-family HTH domain
MVSGGEKFGAFVRRERGAKEIGLREMAKMIGVSPTYLSKVERDEFPPPAEDKVKAIAKIIECDADDMLARAGRVSTDISDIIKSHPIELAKLLRTTKGLSVDDLVRLVQRAQGFHQELVVARQRAAVSKPRNPAQAREWLRSLANQIEDHLHEYAAHETLADARYLQWFVDAAKKYAAKKSLDQLLALQNAWGRPKAQVPGKHFDLARKIFQLRSTKSSTRKSEMGESKPMSWKEIGRACGMSPNKARKIFEQERSNVSAAIAKELAARRRR